MLSATVPGAIAAAAALLQAGKLVAYPTDTLYGVGASPFLGDALAALYRAKARPAAKGIPILLADVTDVEKVARNLPESAAALISRHWPGPLTVIVPRRTDLPALIAPGDTIALRIPDHEVARALIRAAGGAVATSSANRSGEPPAQTAGEALAALGSDVAAVLDGGPAHIGQPSTIVDCTCRPPRILRAGPLTAEALSLGAA